MSEPGLSGSTNPASSNCFICSGSLKEGEIVLVKEKGIKTLQMSSAALKNADNECLLKHLTEIYVHTACQKRYNNPKLIKAAVKRGNTNVKRTTRASTNKFNFKEHCFLCGEVITKQFIDDQKKKPPGKRNTVITVEKKLNSNILKAAERRGDEWAMKIKERISEETDLVAVDARYHLFCQRQLYKAPRKGLQSGGHRQATVDQAMEFIFAYLEEHADECQFSLSLLVDLIEREKPDSRTIKKRLFDKYGDNILIADVAFKKTVVCFKNTGHKILTNAWYEETSKLSPEHERLSVVKAAADIIREDIRSQVYDTAVYPPSTDFFNNANSVIPESLKLLLKTLILTHKRGNLDHYHRKCEAFAHSIISSVRPRSFLSSLLHGIGTYIYHKFGSKHLVEMLASLGFSASYKEITALESSAIMRPDKLQLDNNAFIQFSFDNADFNVNTLDGLGTFHAMGGIMMVTPNESVRPEEKIQRLTHCSAKQLVQQNPPLQLDTFYNVNNKGLSETVIKNVETINPMPENITPHSTDIAWLYGKSLNVQWLPGWSAFMEEATKDLPFSKSKVICLPFINHTPSQYDTILTSLRMANQKFQAFNQKTCFVTFDQPLYIKAREILANNSDSDLNNVVVRLGGFHLLMSFMGTIGNIMEGSGLKELFANIYAENSIDKIMSGHSYARAVRAHTITYLALAQEVVKTIVLTSEETVMLENLLSDCDKSRILKAHENEKFQSVVTKFNSALLNFKGNGPTAQLWVNYFQIVTLIKQFIQAERMGDWSLHLNIIQQMLPFFHAAGHFFYAKCAHLYLQDMLDLGNKMDSTEYSLFTADGLFTIRRSQKFWSGVWTDMTIEQVLMRSMKSYGGLTRGRGITETVLTRWTLGMIYLQSICATVEDFCNVNSQTTEQHVEMRMSRISRDEADTKKLSNWFLKNPPFREMDVIMSLSSGLVGEKEVNCHMARDIGKKSMLKIVGENFQNVKFKRKTKIVSLSSTVRTITVGNRQVTIDPLTLFHRICVMKQSDEEVKNYLTYELSPFPMSLFTQEGMRKGNKSSFYSAFKPVNIDESKGKSKFVVVDGGHLLHKVVWPKHSSFDIIAAQYVKYLETRYGQNIAVVFDGYPTEPNKKSTKSCERNRRAQAHSSPEVIFEETTITNVSQKNFLFNDKNKLRFIQLLKVKFEAKNIEVLQAEEDADTLIITTGIKKASDFQVVFIAGEDIDLLVILIGLKCPTNGSIYFQKCGRGKAADVFYSTTSTSTSSHLITFSHAFSGCDSTSCFFGHGKLKLLQILQKNVDLKEKAAIFSNPGATAAQVAEAGEKILTHLYGGESSNQTLNDLRYKLFTKAAVKSSFNLARLPPTQDAAKLHSFRTYYQVQQWLGYENNPLKWGWVATARGLSPKMMSREVAPSNLLNMIFCSCKKGCRNACSCRKAGLKCSLVCNTCNGQSCENIPEIKIDIDENTLDLDDLDNDMDRVLDVTVSQLKASIKNIKEQHKTIEDEEEDSLADFLSPGDIEEIKEQNETIEDEVEDSLGDLISPGEIEEGKKQHETIEDKEEDGLMDFLGPGPSKKRKKH